MTILIGVLCQDGVVIGADSASTSVVGELRTTEQPTLKIDILCNGKVIVAHTGAVGLAQRFRAVVESSWAPDGPTADCISSCKLLTARAIADFRSTLAAYQNSYGALVAFPCAGKMHLCEFGASDFQPEQKTEHYWYVAMGSGQVIIDPFLALMRKVFWRNGRPSRQDGIFAVTWALRHAIDVNAGGINGPMNIAVLYEENGKTIARLLEPAELDSHERNVIGIEEHLRAYTDGFRGQGKAGIPAPPPIPTS